MGVDKEVYTSYRYKCDTVLLLYGKYSSVELIMVFVFHTISYIL